MEVGQSELINVMDSYNNNAAFKKYVDRFCSFFDFSIDQILEFGIIQIAAEYYNKTESREEEDANGLLG